MPQADLKTTTTRSTTDAKALIAAHRLAQTHYLAADGAAKLAPRPNRATATVLEIGPGCVVHDLAELQRVADQHIRNSDMHPVEAMEFRRKVAKYRDALKLLHDIHDEWSKQAGIDEIDQKQNETYNEREKAYKALIARIKSHPRDVAEIARYFALEDTTPGEYWRPREVLKAIGANGKAVRQ